MGFVLVAKKISREGDSVDAAASGLPSFVCCPARQQTKPTKKLLVSMASEARKHSWSTNEDGVSNVHSLGPSLFTVHINLVFGVVLFFLIIIIHVVH